MPIIQDLPPTPGQDVDKPPPSRSKDVLNETSSVQHVNPKDSKVLSFFKKMNLGAPNIVRPRRNLRAWEEGNALAVENFVKNSPAYNLGEVEKYRFEQQYQKPIKKKNVVIRKVLSAFDSYCDKSTLHGLRYIGDNTLSTSERLFWLISFLLAFVFAVFFITSLYAKFNLSPVIVSFNPLMTPINRIPFPAITICNVNIATKDSVENIDKFGSTVEKRLLSDMCDRYEPDIPNHVEMDETADWLTVRKLIIDINQKCESMFKVCYWENKNISCDQFINSILTDEGYCCSFNRLPSNYSLRNAGDEDLNETYPGHKVDWNPENGYPPNSPDEAYPLRSFGAGARLGLTLIMDADLAQYYCTTTSSSGFKVLLSNPIETPKIADFGFLMAPGQETRITIKPNIFEASLGIRTIDVEKRQCFFTHERYLQFFRTYSERNCRLECQANFTLDACGCVPYFLPKNASTRICGKRKEQCTVDVKEKTERFTTAGNACDCLPGCFELSYEAQTVTMGKISKRLNNTVGRNYLGDVSHEYFAENMAVASFFFPANKYTKQMKSELYGFSEFLSNTGGLLGLFMGFSFLSAVEIVYFLVIKTACSIYKHEKKKREKKNHVLAKEVSTLPYVQ